MAAAEAADAFQGAEQQAAGAASLPTAGEDLQATEAACCAAPTATTGATALAAHAARDSETGLQGPVEASLGGQQQEGSEGGEGSGAVDPASLHWPLPLPPNFATAQGDRFTAGLSQRTQRWAAAMLQVLQASLPG